MVDGTRSSHGNRRWRIGLAFFGCTVILTKSLATLWFLGIVVLGHVGGRQCTPDQEEEGKKWEREKM